MADPEARGDDVGRSTVGMFAHVPHTEDPRQALFRKGVAQMRAKDPSTPLTVIPTTGYPASAPDLGWLMDRAEAFWRERPKLSVQRMGELTEQEITHAVQRVKRARWKPWDGWNGLDFSFATKDDGGWYEYTFGIARPDR